MVKRMCGVFCTEIFLSMENSFKNYPKSSFFPVGSEEGVFYNKKKPDSELFAASRLTKVKREGSAAGNQKNKMREVGT